jgi:transposase
LFIYKSGISSPLAMLRQARKHKDFKRLCQIPGLGFVSVSRLIAPVGTPFRFQTKRQFWKYCGLAVTTRSSTDHLIVMVDCRKGSDQPTRAV